MRLIILHITPMEKIAIDPDLIMTVEEEYANTAKIRMRSGSEIHVKESLRKVVKKARRWI